MLSSAYCNIWSVCVSWSSSILAIHVVFFAFFWHIRAQHDSPAAMFGLYVCPGPPQPWQFMWCFLPSFAISGLSMIHLLQCLVCACVLDLLNPGNSCGVPCLLLGYQGLSMLHLLHNDQSSCIVKITPHPTTMLLCNSVYCVLLTTVYYCVLLTTTDYYCVLCAVYYCVLLTTTVYYVLLCTADYYCALCTTDYYCVLCTTVYYCVLLTTTVYCVLLTTTVCCVLLCTTDYYCVLCTTVYY